MTSEISEQQQQLGFMWRKYMRLTRAGVSVLTTLEVMQEEEVDAEMRALLSHMRESLAQGNLLSEFMSGRAGVFSRSTIELIRTAEKHGVWDEALTELVDGLLDGTFR